MTILKLIPGRRMTLQELCGRAGAYTASITYITSENGGVYGVSLDLNTGRVAMGTGATLTAAAKAALKDAKNETSNTRAG